MDTFAYIYGKNLYVNLTNRCCNDCVFCLRNNGEGIGEEKLWLSREGSPEEIKAAAQKLSSADCGEIVFCGYGESTYRLDALLELASYFKVSGKRTRLDTNGLGSLINGFDIVPRLKGNIDAVSVSLNECTAALYDKVSRSAYGEAAFDAVLAFAAECREAGIDTQFTVVDVIPAEDIEKCRHLSADMGIRLRVRKYIN